MSVKRVLVIDDEKIQCAVIKACLERIGRWEVLTVQSGSEGLLLASFEAPDAILLDMAMPKMDGLQVLQALKDNPVTQKIPVILVTARVLDYELKQFEKLDVVRVVAKPFEPSKLVGVVAEFMR